MSRALRRESAYLLLLGAAALLAAGRRRTAGGAAALAALLRLWPSAGRPLRDDVVVITGGSRGLGLALATRFLAEGARVALLARDNDELHRARMRLAPAPGQVVTVRCDVTKPEEMKTAVECVLRSFGRIDILVNNAGTIVVGPFETMGREDFDALLKLSVHAVVAGVKAVLPSFRRQGGGHLVNICSFGGKVGIPHMSPYCVGKFALAGLSEALAVDLARDNVRVTAVYPSVMRVGSPIQAVFKGDAPREYGWFAFTSLLPGLSVSAGTAARRIVRAVRHGDQEIVFPTPARLAVLFHALFPQFYALAQRIGASFFPQGRSSEALTGAASRHWAEHQPWFRPLASRAHKLEERWNQRQRFNPRFNMGLDS